MGGYCTVEYDGRKQAADHLRGAFNLRERVYATGAKVEVSAEEAGLLVKSAPANTVTVHSGELVHAEQRSRRADEQAIRVARLRETFPKDPSRMLSGVSPVPKEVREALAGKGAEAFIDAGKADACLFDAAHWAQLSGLGEVAKRLTRRTQG
jgi:hypothetical protein